MRRNVRSVVLVGLIVLGALALAGCGLWPGSDPLTGSSWQLASDSQAALVAGTTITAQFEDGNLTGSAGCNRFSGQYTVKGDTLTVGPLASTEMACLDPAGAMEQEARFLAALSVAQTFQVHQGQLVVTCADGQVLTFAAR